ncbi:MAG: response regulator [Luteolibacter sp.]
MASGKKSNIWVVEDHETFGKQLERLINGEDDMCCEHVFRSPAAFFEKLEYTKNLPDVLVLDIGLPGMDGLELLQEVRKAMPDQKVLMLSSFDDKDRVYRAICNGASGYLLKSSDPDEIVAGLRNTIRGVAALSGSLATMILSGFAKHGPVDEIEPLTAREEEVLKYLVQGQIKKEIAQNMFVSPHTVDMHLRSVYRKLEVKTQTEAVAKALRQGIV